MLKLILSWCKVKAPRQQVILGDDLDATTGFSYAKNRWLDSNTYSFTSLDLVYYLGDTSIASVHFYVEDNPVNFSDSEGLCWKGWGVACGITSGVGSVGSFVVSSASVLTQPWTAPSYTYNFYKGISSSVWENDWYDGLINEPLNPMLAVELDAYSALHACSN